MTEKFVTTRCTVLDVVLFIRGQSEKLKLTYAMQMLLIHLASRNGINSEYKVNQTQLAKDLAMNVRNVRTLITKLIEKNIIKIVKKWRDNYYSLCLLTESITGSQDPATKNVTGSQDPLITGSQDPLMDDHTIYINRNNNRNILSRSVQDPGFEESKKIEQMKKNEGYPNFEIISDIEQKNPNQRLRFSSEHFETFLKEHPNFQPSTRTKCEQAWLNNDCEKIGHKIIDDLRKRKKTDVQWIENIRKNTVYFIPKALTHLQNKIWIDEIRVGTSHENSNRHHTTSHKSAVMQRYSDMCQLDIECLTHARSAQQI